MPPARVAQVGPAAAPVARPLGTSIGPAPRWSARGGGAWPAGGRAPCAAAPTTVPDRTPPRAAAGRAPGADEFVPERWVRTTPADGGRPCGRSCAHRPTGPSSAPAELPPDIANELASAAGPDWSHLRDRITERMAAGIGAYERERYRDASRILQDRGRRRPQRPVGPGAAGLSQYHQGYWKAALPNLEAFAALTGSVDQHPVRMDCQRALGRPEAGGGALHRAAAGIARPRGALRGPAGPGRDPGRQRRPRRGRAHCWSRRVPVAWSATRPSATSASGTCSAT